MDDSFTTQLVYCRRCRYRFKVQVSALSNWEVEASCPCCDGQATFTVADTQTLPKPDVRELDAAAQRLGELLSEPIREHQDHPAVVWMDRVGNGLFEDDFTEPCWPVPWWIYRFTRRTEAAYIWAQGGVWFVRRWHPLRGFRKSPEPVEVSSFEEALDLLTT